MAACGSLDDDRDPAVETWFVAEIARLARPIADELHEITRQDITDVPLAGAHGHRDAAWANQQNRTSLCLPGRARRSDRWPPRHRARRTLSALAEHCQPIRVHQQLHRGAYWPVGGADRYVHTADQPGTFGHAPSSR